MNFYAEMLKEVEKFCNSNPPDGFEINYLKNAKKIDDLLAEASTILDEEEVDEKSLEEIYTQVKKLAD